MKHISINRFLVLGTFLMGACTPEQEASTVLGLKEPFEGSFYIGTALNEGHITGQDTGTIRVIKHHFNAIVAENCMKSEEVQPEEGQFDFSLADQFVAFGEQNNMLINGHTLIWHSQAPKWFFVDSLGNDVSKEVLIKRMKSHISNVVGRYKGRVKTWDVVNEAILDDGSWRQSKFYQIVGEDFVKLAFQFAQEADPDAELYYNDFSMAKAGKRAGVISMIQKLQADGVQVDGIGMQGHLGLDYPDINDFEASLLAFSDLGVKVMITELDITVLPSPQSTGGANVADHFEYQQKMNPYPDGLPDTIHQAFNARYLSVFKLLTKHQDKIDRVTLWGVNDGQSWRNDWPIVGRTDYPLLFDRDNSPKRVVKDIVAIGKK